VDDGADSLGVVMSRQAHEDIGLANIDELAEKIIGKKVPVFHFNIP
jgi:hypothetical protein